MCREPLWASSQAPVPAPPLGRAGKILVLCFAARAAGTSQGGRGEGSPAVSRLIRAYGPAGRKLSASGVSRPQRAQSGRLPRLLRASRGAVQLLPGLRRAPGHHFHVPGRESLDPLFLPPVRQAPLGGGGAGRRLLSRFPDLYGHPDQPGESCRRQGSPGRSAPGPAVAAASLGSREQAGGRSSHSRASAGPSITSFSFLAGRGALWIPRLTSAAPPHMSRAPSAGGAP
ncbi:hypothetical protein NDU88_001864 [Pleurodeles waltl]|uniref:Uncharacterized protein n=1 Tax=Pleurodeles waltl TaxID=8319 RepID=A0AAV7NBZ1_PLEWA|nr:hypothetical protein NDU88_001864 [Pleurodeles waltl]